MTEEVAPPAAIPPPSRSLRIWYSVVQSITLSVFIGLCFVARKFEEIFKQMEMSQLPAPTELCIWVAGLVRTPAGLLLVGVAGTVLVVLGLRGRLDANLRRLVAGNVLVTFGMMGFYSLSLFMPIVQIQRALSEANK